MELYGLNWPYSDPIDVEVSCIRRGGKWQQGGKWRGEGLAHHYQRLQSHLWAWKKWDRWSKLILENLLENRFTFLSGPANSAKTHSVASYIVSRYLCFSRGNCNLVSSTDSRSLELRVWGEIKKLWGEAKVRYPDTPGRLVESKQMIVTDDEDEEASDWRNGIIAIPALVGGAFVTLSRYCGVKSGSVFLAGDEAQFMPLGWVDVVANMAKNHGFKMAAMFNPKDRTDAAGKLAEPQGGWETYAPTGKTMVWRTRFPGGKCIQLDGRDSPNNEARSGQGWPWPHLINRDDITSDIAFYGEDSIQVSMMDYGVFPKDAQARRVVTRSMCERHRAQEEPLWGHEPLVSVLGIDAAYGAVGGDRCVAVELTFGKCSDGVTRIAFVGQPNIIPVKGDAQEEDGRPIPPETQIARWVKRYCESVARVKPIPLSHVGFDSTGRGLLVKTFAEEWGHEFHAIEFGGMATERPVSAKIATPRSKYYFNFVSELWFALPVLIGADQCRALPTSIMEEFCMRAWDVIKDKKVQVEPKSGTEGKPGCKQRMGRSPDLADASVVAIEVAQRNGFELAAGAVAGGKAPRWLEALCERAAEVSRARQLVYR